MLNFDEVKLVDKEVYESIMAEYDRQNNGLEMIASENIPSKAVLQAQASYHTLKYSEGYPKARYYAGCENVDKTEQLAIDRACKLFGCKYANVQPHSGANANTAVQMALMKPGEKAMGMSLNSGGHLTHFSKPTFSGKFFEVQQYEVDEETYLLNYDAIKKQALEFLPKVIFCGASAYPRTIDFSKFREITDAVTEKAGERCYLVADVAHIAGLVVTGLHPHPFPYCDIVTTTTHKTLR